MDVFKPRAIYN